MGVVRELIELGLAEESFPSGPMKAGRPSLTVSPDPRVVVIGVDVAVDAVTVALIGFTGRFVRKVRHDFDQVPTPRDVVDIVVDFVKETRNSRQTRYRIAGIGVAIPGQVTADDGVVREAAHLGWRNSPLQAQLERLTGLPTALGNAAKLALVAESAFGAGVDVNDLVYIIGGASGIGGGVVVGGKLIMGSHGYAGEIGHMLVRNGGVACPCGSRGCLETELVLADLLRAAGLQPSESAQLLSAVLSRLDSNPELREMIRRMNHYLAIAIKGVVNLLNPQLVLLDGFLTTLFAVANPLASIDSEGRPIMVSGESVQVSTATVGADGTILGAAELIFERVITEPQGFFASVEKVRPRNVRSDRSTTP